MSERIKAILFGAMILIVAWIFISSVVIVVGDVYDGIDLFECECECDTAPIRRIGGPSNILVMSQDEYREIVERDMLYGINSIQDKLDTFIERPGFGWRQSWDINTNTGQVRGSGPMDTNSCVYMM